MKMCEIKFVARGKIRPKYVQHREKVISTVQGIQAPNVGTCSIFGIAGHHVTCTGVSRAVHVFHAYVRFGA